MRRLPAGALFQDGAWGLVLWQLAHDAVGASADTHLCACRWRLHSMCSALAAKEAVGCKSKLEQQGVEARRLRQEVRQLQDQATEAAATLAQVTEEANVVEHEKQQLQRDAQELRGRVDSLQTQLLRASAGASISRQQRRVSRPGQSA